MDEEESTIGIITDVSIDVIASLRSNLPSKMEEENRDSRVLEYFSRIARVVSKIVSETEIVGIIIGGPGFMKHSFKEYLNEKVKIGIPTYLIGTSSATISGLREVMRSTLIKKLANEYKVMKDAELVEKLIIEISRGSNRVTYGLEQVKKALIYGAVEKLLVLDDLFLENDEIQEIISECKKQRGEYTIVSSRGEAGETLKSLGGIAAFLRFPVE